MQAAKGGGVVTIPGGGFHSGIWRCGTEGRVHWPWWGWLGVGLSDLSGLFQPYDAMILLVMSTFSSFTYFLR